LFNTTAYIIIVLHLMLIVYGTVTRYHHWILRAPSSLVPVSACNQVFVQTQLGLASGHRALLTHKSDAL